MKDLLKIEWLKMKDYGVFKVFGILILLGAILTNYISLRMTRSVVSGSAGLINFDPYSFSNTWHTTSYATGWILILPAMLLIILVTNEYAYKTSRQNVIDGLSRTQFVSVKLVMALIFALVCTVIVALIALLFGFASGTSFALNEFSHVGFFFLKAFTYNVIAVFVSVLVKKTGFAIGLYFIYLGAENLISLLLDLYSVKMKLNSGIDLGSLGDYLPMSAADGLLTNPASVLKNMAKGQLPTEYFWLVLILALVYLGLFCWWSLRRVLKADM